MTYSNLKNADPLIYNLLKEEESRQKKGIELIPSENYTSRAVLEALGSVLTDKYSEGYCGNRYYEGNSVIDKIENLAKKRAIELFNVPHANVQPYSGSPANLAVYLATCSPGDTVLGLGLTNGGHLTHGSKASITGRYFKSIPYLVKTDGSIDYEAVEELATEHKPVLIWCGATAYVKKIDYSRFAQIAESCGAYLAADIAHISGLIIAGVHPSPVEYAHIVTTTTHKTLRGPRGGIIMVTRRGLEKDPDLAKKIDKSVFPGLQGGPHNNTTSAIAVALKEASEESFKEYAKNIVENASVLAEELMRRGFNLIGNGTENHLILIDMRPMNINGWYFAKALEAASIVTNKNTVPGETNSPFYPSGIRIGTPAITSRGMNAKDMVQVAQFMSDVKDALNKYKYISVKMSGKNKIEREQFKSDIAKDKDIIRIRKEVEEFASKFIIPSLDK